MSHKQAKHERRVVVAGIATHFNVPNKEAKKLVTEASKPKVVQPIRSPKELDTPVQ